MLSIIFSTISLCGVVFLFLERLGYVKIADKKDPYKDYRNQDGLLKSKKERKNG